MASLRQMRSEAPAAEKRNGFDNVQSWIKMANATFPVGYSGLAGQLGDSGVDIDDIYRSNGIVFAVSAVRLRVFSAVTFRFAAVSNGKTGRLFGTPELDILSKPWPGGTQGDLASRMIQDVDTAGNFYAVRNGNRLYRRDPEKMYVILSGDPKKDEFVDVAGYAYRPNGKQGPVFTYLPSEVCHWMPQPDPENPWRGMSWITPVLREVAADNAATNHKAKFFQNAATPNMIVKFPEAVMNQDDFNRFKAKMEQEYASSANAHKTLYLAPGADVQVVGTNFDQLDFSNTQGRDETRIASAAGVPAVIAGLKESLAGSSLNQGNYAAARRSLADITMHNLFSSAAGALETLVPPPRTGGPAKLWFDSSDIPFFREDRGDAATIQQTKANTIKALGDAGYTPESVIAAVEQENYGLLVHTGMFSVQLQAPGSQPSQPGRGSVIVASERSGDGGPLEAHYHFHAPDTNVDLRADVHVPEQLPPAVTVEARVDSPPPVVNVNVPEQPAPTVNVTNEVAPTPVTVQSDVTVQPADVVVAHPARTKTVTQVTRDRKGEITGSVAETTNEE